jgi:alkyl hydroperoxide reductase subunit AhpC
LYSKYHDRGFEIFSIALEQNPRNWQRAIAEDGMVWHYQTMESADFGGPVSRHFNIKSIPAIFLINPDGKIMHVNPAPDDLDKILNERLPAGR